MLFNAHVNQLWLKLREKQHKDTKIWRYEIEGVSQGSQGTYLPIGVWSYSKKPKVAIEQAKKNAVHGVIFRGYDEETKRA